MLCDKVEVTAMDCIWYLLGLSAYSLLALAAAMWLRKRGVGPVSLPYGRWKNANRLDKFASVLFTMVACVVFAVKPGNDRGANNESRSAIVRPISDCKQQGANRRDATQGISSSDYEAGFVLAEERTGETHDFAAPTNAVWNQDWLNHGGFCDSFRLDLGGLSFPFGTNAFHALTVFQRGLMRLRTSCAASCFAPMETTLGMVPEYGHSMLPAANRPSGLWHCMTASNSVVVTWRNVLLNREANRPVTFQAEIFEDGCFEFRYDLSCAGFDEIPNVVVGAKCDSLGSAFDSISANVTTLRWQRLDLADADNSDPDGDGITTADEVFAYHTNPYNADSDFDGVSDYDEINAYGSDPNDAHSLSQSFCDSFALAIGDEDPFACPEGSTNTIYEHVFYTGTTNAPFAYPQPNEESAVLEIAISGTGTGEMVLGDKVIPLVAPPQMRSGTASCKLLEEVGFGVKKRLWFRKPEGLEVSLSSDNLLIGSLPGVAKFYGWIAFPHTDATVPCIHDLEAKGRTLSLEHGEEFPGLTAQWQCSSPSVAITNFPPVSADIRARFPTRETAAIYYTVDHPDRLNCYAPSFEQTLEFCPKLTLTEESDLGNPDDGAETNICHCVTQEGLVCGCCAYGCCHCPNPDCPCHGNPVFAPDATSEEEAEDGYGAAMALPEALNVLQLYGNVSTQDVVHLDVPSGPMRQCCSCPGHRTNHVALAHCSRRLSVADSSGEVFSVTNVDCNVVVRGLEPSISPFGDAVLFSTNGASYLKRKYTVLGVRMDSPYGHDTSLYNSLSPNFGVPVTINTNLANAARFDLHTDILLSNGLVRVALENANCAAQVWLPEYSVWRWENGETWLESHPPVLLLDAGTATERYFTMRQWRTIVSHRGSDRCQPLMLVSPNAGNLDLVFSYVAAHDGHAVKTGIRQRVTFVNPPLLPDYDRDGGIGAADIARQLAGGVAYFWVNDDKWRGDDAFETFLRRNSDNDVVDGRNDLVNFLPIAVDVATFASNWISSAVYYRLEPQSCALQNAKLAFADIDWSEIGDAALGTDMDIHGNPLHQAPVSALGRGTNLPAAFVALAQQGRSTLLVEFPVVARNDSTSFNVYSSVDDSLLFSASLNLHIGDVSNMIGWENLRSVAGGSDGVPTRLATEDWPAEEHEPGNVVFVHGYNMAEDAETPLWAKNVFKKLWWSGLDRGFIAIQWRGNEGQTYIPLVGFATPNYYGNVQNAFKTAAALSNAMENVQGPKWFLAHSLGNMLVSAAIQDYGMEYERYFMLNAAIALEAFDPVDGITPASHDNMTPEAWTNYTDNVRATHWFERFPEGDGRRLLTWKGRFSNVTNIVNFYSTQEEVVNNGDGHEQSLFVRNYVWYNQETRKGMWPMMLHEYEGGWAFNLFYDTVTGSWVGNEYVEQRYHMNPTNAAGLTDLQLQQMPFFLDFYNSEMHTSPNGAIVESNYLYRAEMLAYAIPAESYAVGANPLPGLNAHTNVVTNESIPSRNFNMADIDDGQADLPPNEAEPTKRHRDWQHSTFVQRSYKRVHQLYRVIIQHVKENQYE